MSSARSFYAQVGPREKFLITVGSAGDLVALADNETVESSMGLQAFGAATETPTNPETGTMFRDLGKTVVVHDDTTLLAVAKYQKVQLVNGGTAGDSEGVGNFEEPDAYLLVWTASGKTPSGGTISFARVG